MWKFPYSRKLKNSNFGPPSEWKDFLFQEFSQPYMQELKAFLEKEKSEGVTIYPPPDEVFNAFNSTPLSKIKVVILGQDPYHGKGQAHGLSFSVKEGMPIPPSLQNIFKELKSDLGFEIPSHGNLTTWANQGVLLLNTVLTVRSNEPASHQNKGWELFTDAVIKKLQASHTHLVFLLWGKFAQSKAPLINSEKHCILSAAHPSPFSAYAGFFGSRPFSKSNAYLKHHHLEMIHWQLN